MAACLHCAPFAVQGACEHAYCALLYEGKLSTRAPWAADIAKRGGRKRKAALAAKPHAEKEEAPGSRIARSFWDWGSAVTES
jgi:hypothetical protein